LRPAVSLSWLAAGAIVGADVATFALLTSASIRLEAAQAGAFVVAAALALLLLRRAHRMSPAAGARGDRVQAGTALVVIVLAYILRAGVLGLCTAQWSWPALFALVPASLSGLAVGLFGVSFCVRGPAPAGVDGNARLRQAAALSIGYLLALRLVYLGQVELIPQEAYYWNYAEHLDLGYLDHPPLVAWLIAAAKRLHGSEFFVRLPAVASWALMLVFSYRYAKDLAGEATALRTALLATVLPYFFAVGVFVTPDSPLAAAWAAALFYLRRALLEGDRRAWLGAGIAIGAGMLSKYSMILIPLAAFVFVLLDPASRRTLLSPWAWAAVAASLVVFSPVIVWNVQHDWASYTFQFTRRLARSDAQFSFHLFLGYVLLLVTPWGIAAMARVLARARLAGTVGRTVTAFAAAASNDDAGRFAGRNGRFVMVFTLVPLAAFGATSFWSETKIHWTGPIWLAVLPAIAAGFSPPRSIGRRRPMDRALARSFEPLVHGLMVTFAFLFFYYPVYGLGGIRAHHHYFQMGWRDLRASVQEIEDEVRVETGRRPAVVGLDKHNIADEMAYYDPRGDGALDTASRHLFSDTDSVMYEFWYPRIAYEGRDLIAVARRRTDLDDPQVALHATRLGEIRTLVVRKGGVPVGQYFARVVYGYLPGLPGS
jgi:dolichol-phosphate mannosyltransferase